MREVLIIQGRLGGNGNKDIVADGETGMQIILLRTLDHVDVLWDALASA